MTVVVINAVGLTPRALAHMPRLQRLAADGFQAQLDPVLPAVTCSVQSTMLTGLAPTEHGIVGNGWYFRDLGEVFLWRQHNALVQGEKVWETARRAKPDFRAANLCWWYAMGATTDLTVTPRPIYHADGAKSPDCYTDPPELHDRLTGTLGEFPLFTYWGPTANITSSKWIADAAKLVLAGEPLDLLLVYLPHLDYDLQRFGPDDPRSARAAGELDEALAPLLDDARRQGRTVVALSEYAITPVSRPVDVNRELRRAGLLEVHTQDGMEYLDAMTSRAFAVADHQIAHVYVRRPEDLEATRKVLATLPGIAELLDDEGKKRHGLDHPRSGEFVAVADPDAWFTYYYWLDDDRAPDFARLVEIHRKPGYDPVELFMDPEDPYVRVKAATALARKKLGMRYRMAVVPLDPSPIRGSHGRLPASDDEGPLIICSIPRAVGGRVAATEVKSLLLRLAGLH
jgi:predicted AlkP superfamily pyrophosphatase or phosphodiesterase